MEGLKLLDRKLKYKAHRVKVYEDTLEKPDGARVYYDYVENRNGSGVLLVDRDGRLLFVKQYRNSINDYDIEIPAGCVEDIDSISESEISRETFENVDNAFYKCAIREAEEETGQVPQRLSFVNYIIAAAGLFSERTAIYIGEELAEGSISRDPDEYIEIVRLSLDEAMDYISRGLINDSKTIIAVMAYALSR